MTSSSEIPRRHRALAEQIGAAAGQAVMRLEFPGGSSRKSFRAYLADGTRIFATKRRSSDRARIEAETLKALNAASAPAPELIGLSDGLMLQQDVGFLRLTEALHQTDDLNRREDLMSRAIFALVAGQAAVEASPVKDQLELKGADMAWRERLVRVPQDIGRMLEVPAPALDVAAISDAIAVTDDHCIKWDARPGNAVIDEDGMIRWIDWDHMGRRNRVDDLIWLMADEYVNIPAAIETRLLHRHLADFTVERSERELLRYLYLFGVFHSCVRLELILGYRHQDRQWWDFEMCLSKDKVGMTRACCLRLCERGARWAAADWLTLPLANWFAQVSARLHEI